MPKSDYAQAADGRHILRSLLDGTEREIRALRLVDATTSNVEIPATRKPLYDIQDGVTVVPINGLPDLDRGYAGYTVVGGGKTGMDACIWLVEHGVSPSAIRWIVPNDPWMIPREASDTYPAVLRDSIYAFGEVAKARSIEQFFNALEHGGTLVRLDPEVQPTSFRCANVSRGELGVLRRLGDVVRLDRLTSIAPDRLFLEQGVVPADRDTLYVDCSASAIKSALDRPVFETDRINLQGLRWCQPLFSADRLRRKPFPG